MPTANAGIIAEMIGSGNFNLADWSKSGASSSWQLSEEAMKYLQAGKTEQVEAMTTNTEAALGKAVGPVVIAIREVQNALIGKIAELISAVQEIEKDVK